MKANEVLEKYAAGERDFRRANLRGQSFQGKDLSGADFSQLRQRPCNYAQKSRSNQENIHSSRPRNRSDRVG
ncbi:MAG: pentapeptide repeat-containing protein [Moorea sp. SIO4G2]|nr:pentapeptide repeat-containing protein [Moorena sp. SIO4G2]